MIRIDDEYAIQADPECWLFGKIGSRRNMKTGEDEEYVKSPVYVRTLDAALNRYAETVVRQADPHSWAEVRNALERVRSELAKITDILTEIRA